MSKHTPGVWVAVGSWVEHTDDNRPDICNCSPESMGQEALGLLSDEEACANARLIAAAPDLLKALQSLVERGTDSSEHIAAEAAIAKATGSAA